MANLESVRARLLRRRVLELLRIARQTGREGWIAPRALFQFLYDETDGLTEGETRDAVLYLADKRYAEVRDLRERKSAPEALQGRITAAGIDLLEASVPPDPGIEDPRP